MVVFLVPKVEVLNERSPVDFDNIKMVSPCQAKTGTKKDFFSGIRGYEKLIRLASIVMKKSSYLVISSCSHHASSQDLITATFSAFNKQNRSCKLIRNFGAGFDHPIHPAIKEGEYLKCLTFYLE
jgi:23S rRNA (cytosine1962-C5)-methyltransferase